MITEYHLRIWVNGREDYFGLIVDQVELARFVSSLTGPVDVVAPTEFVKIKGKFNTFDRQNLKLTWTRDDIKGWQVFKVSNYDGPGDRPT